MNVIVSGSRHCKDRILVAEALHLFPFTIQRIIHGGQRGVDTLAGDWARRKGHPCEVFPYEEYLGRAGGPARNEKMAQRGDALVAIPGPRSTGTWDMIRRAVKHGLPVFIVPWTPATDPLRQEG